MTAKTIFLLRHAKSSWDEPGLADDRRPLNNRGRKAATRMGRYFDHQKWKIDFVICSTAVRTMETAELFFAELKHVPTIAYSDELYLASPDEILELIRQVSEECRKVMLIGHNPGFEEVVAQITNESHHFPTGGLAKIKLEVDQWNQCEWPVHGKLIRLDRPKELNDD